MPQGPEKKNPAFSVIKVVGFFVIGLFLAYVIVGFWVVPPLLKPKLENELSRQIGRNVRIGEIRLNPLALSSTINKLIAYEKRIQLKPAKVTDATKGDVGLAELSLSAQ